MTLLRLLPLGYARVLASALMLLAIAVSADAALPVLMRFSRRPASPLRPNTDFAYDYFFSPGSYPVVLLDIAYKDPNGILQHVISINPRSPNSLWAMVDYTWLNGAYSIQYVMLENSVGACVTYNRDGGVTVDNSVEVASPTHTFNLPSLDYEVVDSRLPIAGPVLTAISRSTVSPVQTEPLAYDYAFNANGAKVTKLTVVYVAPLGAFAPSLDNNPPESGTLSGSVSASGNYNGGYVAKSVRLSFPEGTVDFNRDGSVTAPVGVTGPTKHNLDIRALDFVFSGGQNAGEGPLLGYIARTSTPRPIAGEQVAFDYGFLEGASAASSLEVAFNSPDREIRHVMTRTVATPPFTFCTPVGADWPIGKYTAIAAILRDSAGHVISYNRDGTLAVSNGSYEHPNTHALAIDGLDFSVDPVPATPSGAPRITTQPASVQASIGAPATFAVVANAIGSLAYQWRHDGAPVAGATQASFTIGSISSSDGGGYDCVVTNGSGSIISQSAQLTVTGPTAWLTNVSVRTTLVPGQGPLIVGLSVSGGAKPILLRAAGPALGKFGLTNVHQDPRLDVIPLGGTAPVFSNDNWEPTLSAEFTNSGAFPFPADSKDAALMPNLTGGNSVQVAVGGGGTVLVEAYDTHPNTNTPRLANVSARNFVGRDDAILIEGFSISGTGTKRLLIRAVGPRLTDFGVNAVLADPLLQVIDAGGTVVASNNDWDAALAPLFDSVGAFGLTGRSKDAALVTALEPGSYTVQVKGADGGTGEALVEVYEIP